MTVSSTTYKNNYVAGSGQTIFPYTFRILDEDHIKVFKNDVLLTISTDYSVDGVGDESGGNVTLVVGATAGDSIVIIRDVPVDQQADYTYNDKFPSETHETALDKLTMICQQLQEQLDRAVLFNPSSTASGIDFPDPEANMVIGYDSSGTNLILYDIAAIGAVFTSEPPTSIFDAAPVAGPTGSANFAARVDHYHLAGTDKYIPFSYLDPSSSTSLNETVKFRWDYATDRDTLCIGDDLSGDIPVGQQWGKLHIGYTVTPNISDVLKTFWVKALADGTTNSVVWAGVCDFYHDLTGTTSDTAGFSAFTHRGFLNASARGWTRALEAQTYLYETGTHDPAYSIEIGMHTKAVNTEAHGIYLWSADYGGDTFARAGDAIRIFGNRGWNRGIFYLDTDGTSTIFAVSSTGELETMGNLAFRSGTGNLATLDHGNSAPRSYTLPDASGTFAFIDVAATYTVALLTTDNISWQSGAGFYGTLDHANTAARVYSFLDLTGTVPLLEATGLTWSDHLTTAKDLIMKASSGFNGHLYHSITASRDWLFPDLSGTVVLYQYYQEFTQSIATQQNFIFKSGTTHYGYLDHAITADRTWSFPDASGEVNIISLQQTISAIKVHSADLYLDNGAAASPLLQIKSSGHGFGALDNNAGIFRVRSSTEEKAGWYMDASPTSGMTSMRITYHNGSSVTVQDITLGATDSGGSGYKLLRVPN